MPQNAIEYNNNQLGNYENVFKMNNTPSFINFRAVNKMLVVFSAIFFFLSFYKNVVFPAQPKYSYISCRFHAESILVLYSLIEFKQKNYHDTFQFGGSFPLCCNSILYIFLTSSCAIHQTVISMNIWPYWLVQVFLFCWLVLPVGLSSSVKWK